MSDDFNDDELDGLSDTERAALEADDDEADILAGIAGDDDDGESDDADDGADGDGDEQGEDDAGDDVKPDAPAKDASAADDAAGAPEPLAEFSPQFTAPTTEGLAEKLTEIDGRAAALLKSFQDGDIELSEFMAANQAITDERLQVRMAEEQSKWAQSQNDAQRAQRWQWEQDRFFGQESAKVYKDPIVLAALDASVKQLAASPDNAKRPAAWFLEEADRQVRARFGMGAAPVTPKPGKKRGDPDLSGLPRTLGGLPAAEMADTGADEFAHLDKLDGIQLEAALRKMTPEQESRYLGVA